MTIKRCTQDLPRLRAIPVMNQLLATLLQYSADISRTSTAINHCLKVTEQMGPAELMTMIFQMAVGRKAIADDDTATDKRLRICKTLAATVVTDRPGIVFRESAIKTFSGSLVPNSSPWQ